MSNLKKATLQDVARLAGVGVGSVSRYLNDNTSIKPNTREKIQDAIQKLNYVPNEVARKLAQGKSRNILLLLLSEIPVLISTWIYEKEIIQEIYETMQDTEYALQLSLYSIDRQQEVYAMLSSNVCAKNIEGLIILTNWDLDEKLIQFLLRKNVPYMVVGSKQNHMASNEVLIDNAGAMNQLVQMLASQNHRRIALLTGNRDQEHMAERIKGFQAAIRQHNCETAEHLVVYGDYSMESGYLGAKKLMESCGGNLPTAVLCGNDLIASGAIKAFREARLRIPDDISITGFDNLPTTEVIDPPLTSVQLSSGMGQYATEQLLEMLRLSQNEAPSKVFDCNLVIRESTRAVVGGRL